MNIAILHYHLNRGGVTQVIQNHLRALAEVAHASEIERVAILFGGRKQNWPQQMLATVPPYSWQLVAVAELEYDDSPTESSAQLASALRKTLAQIGFVPDETVLHIHNHALGKNASLPGAIAQLAGDGYRFLLQVHDFIEDFRPDNYRHLATSLRCQDEERLAAQIYPQAESIHYAVLNGRDRAIFRAAGLADRRLHLLPNPVAATEQLPARQSARPRVMKALDLTSSQFLVAYPVRGIRRKNVGEMALLSALDPREATYAVTLAPLNPDEAACFQAWRELSGKLRLRSQFDIGRQGALAYHDILSASDALLTTSVAEGFGMVFLESWLVGQPLIGRDLPEITSDFAAAGVRYDGLYRRLLVPLDFVGEAAFRHGLICAYQTARTAYGRSVAPPAELDEVIEDLIYHRAVDFACLSSRLQREVVTSVCQDRSRRHAVLAANPDLVACFESVSHGAAANIVHNAEVVRRRFSLEAAGEKLVNIYRVLLDAPATGRIHGLPRSGAVLMSFLDIRRLHPVRLELCPPPLKSSDA